MFESAPARELCLTLSYFSCDCHWKSSSVFFFGSFRASLIEPVTCPWSLFFYFPSWSFQLVFVCLFSFAFTYGQMTKNLFLSCPSCQFSLFNEEEGALDTIRPSSCMVRAIRWQVQQEVQKPESPSATSCSKRVGCPLRCLFHWR